MKPRLGRWLAFTAVLAAMALLILSSSIQQNNTVRSMYNQLFTALKNHDAESLQMKFFTSAELTNAYFDVLFKYRLYGWKITEIGNQPWPLNGENYGTVKAELYFEDLPDSMLKPNGPYTSTINGYGPCTVVPVKLRYLAQKDGIFFMPPHLYEANDWPCPYIAPKAPAKPAKAQ